MTRRKNCRIAAAAILFIAGFAAAALAQDDAKWQALMQQAATARQNGQPPEVEKLLKGALEEAEKFGPWDQHVVVSLDALGTFNYTRRAYAEALPVLMRMLEIREHTVGPDHPFAARALSDIAVVENLMGKTAEAEAHSERALKIADQAAAGMSGIAAIAAGGNHTCAVAAGGKVYCWGSNLNGELGVPSPPFSGFPIPLPRVASGVALAAGGAFTCALLADGTVTCWGSNASGQAGAAAGRTAEPAVVAGISNARAIAAGAEHACALIDGGAVRCWGNNQQGQLGNASSPSPVAVRGVTGATALAAGGNHSCAVTADGGVLCWGSFQSGSSPMPAPLRVPGLAGPVTSLAAGSNFSCGLLASGTVTCWWGNKPAAGAAGPASPPYTAPEEVKGLASVRSIAAGYAHTCALLEDGSVRCWGNNREGQLGDGKTTHSTVPVAVQHLPKATAVTSGLAHTCAVLADQTAACWGSDSYGAPSGIMFGLRSARPVLAGRDASSLLTSLNLLADLYRTTGKFDKAEPLYQRAVKLLESARGPQDDSLVPVLNGYADMLRKAGRAEEATKLEERANLIQFKPVLTDVPTQPPPQR